MATLKWIGGTSTNSTDVSNWQDVGTGLPPASIGAGDTFLFSDSSQDDCELNQTTIHKIETLDDFVNDSRKLIFNQSTLALTQMTLANNQTIKFAQSTTAITFSGNHNSAAPEFNHPLIYNGDVTYDATGNAKTTVTYTLNNNNGTAAHLTNGDLPNIVINDKFTWNFPDPSRS